MPLSLWCISLSSLKRHENYSPKVLKCLGILFLFQYNLHGMKQHGKILNNGMLLDLKFQIQYHMMSEMKFIPHPVAACLAVQCREAVDGVDRLSFGLWAQSPSLIQLPFVDSLYLYPFWGWSDFWPCNAGLVAFMFMHALS